METTIHAVLESAAQRFADQPAIIAPDRTLTFLEVDRLATRLALALQRMHIVSGDVVTLWMENGWRWMVCYFAILKCGGVVNPVNVLLTAEEVDFIVRDCKARVLVGGAERLATLRHEISIPCIADAAVSGRDARLLDEMLGEAVKPGEKLLTGQIGSRSPASICYTSGTTGRPKGAVLRHESIVINAAMTVLMHGRQRGDVVVSALPCAHVYGNVVMNAAVACGMTLVLLPRFDEEAVLEAIQAHRATMLEGVPTMYLRLLNFPSFPGFDLSSLRLCTVGGQTMPVSKIEEVERRFGCRLLELWGMTEIGGLGMTHPHNGPHRPGAIGVSLPMSEARVVDVDDGTRSLPRGEAGELLIRGPLVMDGYLGDVQASSETITSDGWLHTGDIVRQDPDGYFYVVDRKKDLIISGGYKIYPAEVERVIAQHPAVAMVAVASMRDDMRGHVARAFIVLRHGRQSSSEEIVALCREHLAAYKIPRAIEFVLDLPRTSTGKILRRVLAEES
jgi:long-chain acyl-CoA synthetase